MEREIAKREAQKRELALQLQAQVREGARLEQALGEAAVTIERLRASRVGVLWDGSVHFQVVAPEGRVLAKLKLEPAEPE